MVKAAIAVVALLLLAHGLVPPAGASGDAAHVHALPDGDFVVQSLWGAKRLVKADSSWFLLRPLWEEKLQGRDVRVAVIDTGIDSSHRDLKGVVVAWKDFAGDADGRYHREPYDDHGHGTHVAGIVAARGHLQLNPLKFYWITGARGMAPAAELIVAKAMKHDGRGTDLDVADAILWALDPNGDGDLSDGADVINLSVGIERQNGDESSLALIGTRTRDAVNLAIMRGVPVVVSSGNDGDRKVAEPGDIKTVIAVGAVDRRGAPTIFTNTGDELDLVAPGVLISTYPRELDVHDHMRDGYAGLAGTSMAAPVVSGIVALLLESQPELKAAKGTDRDYSTKVATIETLLKEHATVPKKGQSDRTYGAGLVNAYGSLEAVDEPTGRVSQGAVVTLAGIAILLAYFLVIAPTTRFVRSKRAAKRRREAETAALTERAPGPGR